MLNRDEIIIILKDLKYDKNEYWVTGGAALVMYGLKNETRDIDLGFTEKLYELLMNEGNCTEKIFKDGGRGLTLNNSCIEFIDKWDTDKIEWIEDIPVGTLESIKKKKLELGREKDMIDVKLIDEYKCHSERSEES